MKVPSEALPVTVRCGVYFLTDGEDNVLYVGASCNVEKRIAYHLYNKGSDPTTHPEKLFKRAYWIATSPEQLGEMERNYISLYRPEMNTKTPVGRR